MYAGTIQLVVELLNALDNDLWAFFVDIFAVPMLFGALLAVCMGIVAGLMWLHKKLIKSKTVTLARGVLIAAPDILPLESELVTMSNTILTGEAAADILAAMQKAGLNGWEMFVPEGVEEIAPGAFAGEKTPAGAAAQNTRRIGAARFMARKSGSNLHCPPGWWNSAQRHSKIAVCRR